MSARASRRPLRFARGSEFLQAERCAAWCVRETAARAAACARASRALVPGNLAGRPGGAAGVLRTTACVTALTRPRRPRHRHRRPPTRRLVAEELDLPMSQVRMMLGDTARAPNQGATIASASIQIHALPLRQAAAQARRWLLDAGREHFGVQADAAESVDSIDGGRAPSTAGASGFGTLVAGRHVVLHARHRHAP